MAFGKGASSEPCICCGSLVDVKYINGIATVVNQGTKTPHTC